MYESLSKANKIFITGGAGFIGSCLARYLIKNTNYDILIYDKLTYAASMKSLNSIDKNPRFKFILGDICDYDSLLKIIENYKPDIIVHLAAETHVDRSIIGPKPFVETNILGTSILLEVALLYWEGLPVERKNIFRFHHVSTDEVFGSLSEFGFFDENTNYNPKSPYSASKASSDHLVRAWFHTYGLPILITNCSNNYGPFQFPEKLIPATILRAINGEPIPVYGKGENIRDWLYVEDHASAILRVFENGTIGSTYVIGGRCEIENINVVRTICKNLDELHPRFDKISYSQQIEFVKDRPGHDYRYAINCEKIERELGWFSAVSFNSGIKKTINWYLQNQNWWRTMC